MKINSTGAPRGTIMVDSDDKLNVNYNSDFYQDCNGSIWLNIGQGLERNSEHTISIPLGCQGVRFVNNRLCADVSALISNTAGSITMDEKERLELNYSIGSCGGEQFAPATLINQEKTVEEEEEEELNYSTDDFMNSNDGKIWLNLKNKHIVRTNDDGISLKIDNDTIKFDSSVNKLCTNIDKYLGSFGLINYGDIYLDRNKKNEIKY